ncbi:hypothetical protein Tco_1298094 [Tanacetum coccineum]
MEVDARPSSPTLMMSSVIASEGREREVTLNPQLRIHTPINSMSNIAFNSQTQPITPVHLDMYVVDQAFVMVNYSQLKPLVRRRMKKLRLRGVATRLEYSSEDADEEMQMEGPTGFQSQP